MLADKNQEQTKTSGAAETDREPFSEDARLYSCPSCGAQMITDATTTAAFCVFCQNPTVFPDRLSGEFKPAKLIPFKLDKDDAKAALTKLCKHKPLLPDDFRSSQHIEKITGVYVPFWLFDCSVNSSLFGEATRIASWSDSNYRYTKTDTYSVQRAGNMCFDKVPADGSSKMEDAMMDALEPYHYKELVDFSMPYLSGYLAEKYDVNSEKVYSRIDARIKKTAQQLLRDTIQGYSSVSVADCRTNIQTEKSDYVLMPVWMLFSTYKDKDYLFAMNGQTGKMVGKLPLSIKRAALWFSGIAAVVFGIALLGGYLL